MAREAREAQGEDWDAAPYVSSDEEEDEEGQQTATVAQVNIARPCFLLICQHALNHISACYSSPGSRE